jgi:hypothetical protein
MPRFCHWCGTVIVESGAFCSACGAPAVSTGPQTAQSPLRSAIQQAFRPVRPSAPADRRAHVGGRQLLVLFLLCVIVASVIEFAPSGTGVKPAAVPAPPKENVAAPISTKHSVGEDFSVGYWSYHCNGATWRSTIPFLRTAEAADAEFLVVDL